MAKMTFAAFAIFSAFLLFTGCNFNSEGNVPSPEKAGMTDSEKETAKKEITARIDEIIRGANQLNVEAALNPYANEESFKIVNPDASVTDYPTMKQMQAEAFETLKSMNFKTIKQDFTFLEEDLVMCTWTGSNEFEMTNGEKMKIEPYVGSMLFRNRNNKWDIIYAHETTAAPVPVK